MPFSRHFFQFTLSVRSEPALNLGRFFSLIFSGSPVLGFLPVRALVCSTSNVPKPIKVTFSPFFNASPMVFKSASKVSFTSFWLFPAFWAVFSINSFLFIAVFLNTLKSSFYFFFSVQEYKNFQVLQGLFFSFFFSAIFQTQTKL